jgi:hypothetical protein
MIDFNFKNKKKKVWSIYMQSTQLGLWILSYSSDPYSLSEDYWIENT